MIDPTNTVCPEWQNENALRAYPLEDDAPAASAIPTWLIADLRITADTAYDHLFVSSAYVSDTLVSVGISGVIGGNPPVGLLTKTVTRDELEAFRAYSMDRLTDTACGSIAFGQPPDDAVALKVSPGPSDSRILESAVVRVKTPGVRKIVDKAHGREVAGIVDLSGNNEFRTYLDPSDATGKTVIVELNDIYKETATSVCVVDPSFSACGETPVKSINGVRPTKDGVITLRFR